MAMLFWALLLHSQLVLVQSQEDSAHNPYSTPFDGDSDGGLSFPEVMQSLHVSLEPKALEKAKNEKQVEDLATLFNTADDNNNGKLDTMPEQDRFAHLLDDKMEKEQRNKEHPLDFNLLAVARKVVRSKKPKVELPWVNTWDKTKNGPEITYQEAGKINSKNIMEVVDTNRDGTISWKEVKMAPQSNRFNRSELDQVFNIFRLVNVDGDGQLKWPLEVLDFLKRVDNLDHRNPALAMADPKKAKKASLLAQPGQDPLEGMSWDKPADANGKAQPLEFARPTVYMTPDEGDNRMPMDESLGAFKDSFHDEIRAFDTNKDGALSLDEALKSVEGDGLSKDHIQKIKDMFAKADKNKDGGLDLTNAEMDTFADMMGKFHPNPSARPKHDTDPPKEP